MLIPTVDDTSASCDKIRHDIGQDIGRHRARYLTEGMIFTTIGILAILLPNITSLATELIIGAALCVCGLIRLGNTLRFRTGRGWRLLSSLLSLGVGSFMLWQPFTGLVLLISMTGILMLTEGVIEIFLAFIYQSLLRSALLLLSGIISLLLGLLIFAGFPVTGIIFIAIAVGLNMILYGLSMITMAWKASTQKTRKY